MNTTAIIEHLWPVVLPIVMIAWHVASTLRQRWRVPRGPQGPLTDAQVDAEWPALVARLVAMGEASPADDDCPLAVACPVCVDAFDHDREACPLA